MLQSLETVDAGASGLSICKWFVPLSASLFCGFVLTDRYLHSSLIMSRPLQDLALSDIHATLLSRLARFTIAYPADLPTSLVCASQYPIFVRRYWTLIPTSILAQVS